LIDATTGTHIWADRFERDLTHVFALQDEVTVAVVSTIQPKLLQTGIATATRQRPENLTAYDYYLRALPQFYLETREALAEAIRLANRAFELDPRFGFAAALAGNSHMNNVTLGYAADPQFDRKEAVRLSRLALRIDDSDPDSLGFASVTSAYIVGDCEGTIEMASRSTQVQVRATEMNDAMGQYRPGASKWPKLAERQRINTMAVLVMTVAQQLPWFWFKPRPAHSRVGRG